MKKYFLIITLFLFANGCAPNLTLPTSSSLNDFLTMSIKTNSDDTIEFTYTSDLPDGLLSLYQGEKEKVIEAVKYNHTQSSTFKRMVQEYLENKFLNINSAGETKIKLHFKDMWCEQHMISSGGQATMAAMFGGEIKTKYVIKSKAVLTVIHNGETKTKVLSTTVDDMVVSGFSTGTSTSNIYQGENSTEFKIAKLVDKSNNKIIMGMNSFLESLDL